MEEIKKTYEEVKGLNTIAKMYNDTKTQISELEDCIQELKNTKSLLNLSQIMKDISTLEIELEDVSKKMECEKIITSAYLSIKELQVLLSSATDSNTCLEKCLKFINNLFVPFNISNSKYQEIFKIQKEEEFFRVLKISREIEELLQIVKERPFCNEITNEIHKRLKLELDLVTPFEIDFFVNKDCLFLVYSGYVNDEDELNLRELQQKTSSDMVIEMPKLFYIVLSILKKNLSISLIEEQYTVEDVAMNNLKLVSTQFYVKNVEEWVIDLAIKEAMSISKAAPDSEKLHKINDKKFAVYVSEQYNVMIKLKNIITKSKSKRRDRAFSMFNKFLMKLFSLDRCLSIKDLFVSYADLSHFTKHYNNFEFINQLNTLREEIFYKILTQSTVLELDLSSSVLMLKAKIKQKQFDFDEYLQCFVADRTQCFFKLQFFEKLFNSFMNVVLKPRKVTEQDKSTLKELVCYIMDISYEVESSSIGNYEKIASLYKVLDSSLKTVVDLYESDEIEIPKNELRGLLRILFDKSTLRDAFIEQLM